MKIADLIAAAACAASIVAFILHCGFDALFL